MEDNLLPIISKAENANKEIVKILRYTCKRVIYNMGFIKKSKTSVTNFNNFELIYGRKEMWFFKCYLYLTLIKIRMKL